MQSVNGDFKCLLGDFITTKSHINLLRANLNISTKNMKHSPVFSFDINGMLFRDWVLLYFFYKNFRRVCEKQRNVPLLHIVLKYSHPSSNHFN